MMSYEVMGYRGFTASTNRLNRAVPKMKSGAYNAHVTLSICSPPFLTSPRFDGSPTGACLFRINRLPGKSLKTAYYARVDNITCSCFFYRVLNRSVDNPGEAHRRNLLLFMPIITETVNFVNYFRHKTEQKKEPPFGGHKIKCVATC